MEQISPQNETRQLCVCVTTGKQFLKVFDGDDSIKRGFFRLVSVLRATKNEEVVVRAPPLPYKHRRCSQKPI